MYVKINEYKINKGIKIEKVDKIVVLEIIKADY